MWYAVFKTVLFVPFVRLWLRPKVSGASNVPASGGVILASNHLSSGDTFTLPAMIKRQVSFPAKAELFRGKSFTGRVVAWFLKAVGQVPMDRSGGRASADALGPVLRAVQDGGVVGIYPEGSRSPDGRLYKGHTGVARLALVSGAPVVPVGMINSQFRKGPLGIPTMRGAKIVIGEPRDYSAWAGQTNDRTVLRWITDDVMAAIAELSGQRYVDAYSSRVKRGTLSAEESAALERNSPLADRPAPPTTAELAAPADEPGTS